MTNKELSREWRKKNQQHIKKYRKIYYVANRINCLLSNYKRKDKKKGWTFDLTEEWMRKNIASKPCTYCGSTKLIGCDRIDNTIGHIKENCVPCCSICNAMRLNHFTTKEMKKIGKFLKENIYPFQK